METKAEALRRKIAILRDYLREGVDVALASTYLRDIAEAQAELKRLDDDNLNRSRLPGGAEAD
jgi:hypothetical protein